MATNSRSRSRENAISHEEHEWDAQKPNFYQCYIQQGLTLKKATMFMSKMFGFHASERQWERKAKQWNFNKYTPQETREQQLKHGHKFDRNYQRWLNRQGKSQERKNDRSRSVSPGVGNLSPSGQDTPRGRPRGKSASSGARSPIQRSQHRRSGGSELLSPQISNEEHKDYDVIVPKEETQKLTSPILPDEFNLKAVAAGPDSESAARMHVTQHYSAVGQADSPPVIQFSIYDDNSNQWKDTSPLTFGNDPMMGGAFNTGNAFLPMQNGAENSQYYQPEYGIAPTDPVVDDNLSGQGFVQTEGSTWDNNMSFGPQDTGATFQTPNFGGGATESFPDMISPEQMMAPGFATPADSYQVPPFPPPQPAIATTYVNDEASPENLQRARNDSLFGMLANPEDPFQLDLFLNLADYTHAVLEQVIKGLRQANIEPAVIEKVNNDVSLERPQFIHRTQFMVENHINTIKRHHQDEHDLCVRLRQREKVLRRIIEENAIDVDIQAELNNSSSNRASYRS